MQNRSYIALSCAILMLCISCQATGEKRAVQEPTMKSVFYLPAVVIEVQQNSVTLRVEKPPLVEEEAKLAVQLARELIEKTYLLEGQKTSVNQSRVEVVRIIGSDILLQVLDKSHSFKPGDRVQILLAKKIIAIKDFEVIMGSNKEVAKYVQEDVTTVLVNSGQFNVVERSKLQSVLEELQMAQAGLIDPASVKEVGKLLGADIILTGTLAPTGDEWNVNLRVINTETGLIAAALNKKGPLHELKAEAFREMRNIDGTFEDTTSDMAGWILGEFSKGRTGAGGYQKIYIDETQGAAGTGKSLTMNFKLGTKRVEKFKNLPIHASITNRLKRDLSNYSGIKFYVKADRDITLLFQVSDSQEGTDYEENWFRNISVTKDWRETRIPFNSLSVQKGRAQKQSTNEILQLNYIEKINWIVHEGSFGRGEEARIWLDEVTFY